MAIVVRCTCGHVSRVELAGGELDGRRRWRTVRHVDCAGCGTRHELVGPEHGGGADPADAGPLSDAELDAFARVVPLRGKR